MPKDSQFPMIAKDLLEVAKYALLWATKDVQRIKDSKIFWVFMEMNIIMGINRNLWLSPIVYNNLHSFTVFKVDFHHVYIRVRKDPVKKWNELPYLAIDDVIFAVLESWSLEWRAPANSMMESEKSIAQRKKEEEKLSMAQLA